MRSMISLLMTTTTLALASAVGSAAPIGAPRTQRAVTGGHASLHAHNGAIGSRFKEFATRKSPGADLVALTIKVGTTRHVNCAGSPVLVCTPNGPGAILSVADLQNDLNNPPPNVTGVQVDASSEAGDIVIGSVFNWANSTGLELDANQSILVRKQVMVNGPAALTLVTNDTGSNGVLSFDAGGSINFLGTGNALTINGQPYALVNSIADLQNEIANSKGGNAGNYALSANYDATPDGTYAHAPFPDEFIGNFEGLGNSISNFSISSADASVGLFAEVGVIQNSGVGAIRDIKLLNVNVSDVASGASVGTLAAKLASNGSDFGSISGIHVTGRIVSGNSSSTGGLVGDDEGQVLNSSTSVEISAKSGSVGGLVGSGQRPDTLIAFSSDTGKVAVRGSGGEDNVGGLAGFFAGQIVGSRATGVVTAISKPNPAFVTVGGLVGFPNGAVIKTSYATGSVTGYGLTIYAGGLVGGANGVDVEESFATGNVLATATKGAGGHAGVLWAGGLVGFPGMTTIENSYATGSVSGISIGADNQITLVGGLSGDDGNTGPIEFSYSTGVPSGVSPAGSNCVGGSIGLVGGTPIGDVYWDTTTSGTNQGVGPVAGCGTSDNIVGLTDDELKASLPAGFDPTIWEMGGTKNRGWPILRNNQPPK